MNPLLMNGLGGRSYIDMYWDPLERTIDAALAGRSVTIASCQSRSPPSALS